MEKGLLLQKQHMWHHKYIYAATGFHFQIYKPNFIFRLMNPFSISD